MAALSVIRRAALALVRAYVPSVYGDAAFSEMINGSWAPGFGTTCGYLTSWVLWRLGCRDARIVNREEPQLGLQYHTGQNMSRLVQGAKALGAYRTTGTPKPGDLYFVFADPPVTLPSGGVDWRNHVGVVMSVDGNTWNTADAGQGSRTAQSASFNSRPYKGGAQPKLLVGGEWRHVHFIDLDAIRFDEPPKPLPSDDGGYTGGLSSGAATLIALLAVVGLGGLWLASRA